MAAPTGVTVTVPHGQLEQGLAQLLKLPGQSHCVLFVADPDPATGLSWCPDCVRVAPAVKRVIAEHGAPLLEVLVGPREEWKSASHPLRNHPQIRLTSVPELIAWTQDGVPGARMGAALEAAPSPEEASVLVTRFLAQDAVAE